MTPASSSRVYPTRHRSRQVDKESRYDDIFSAVTRAVQDERAFGCLSTRLIEENSMPVRMRLFSQSSHSSSSSSEDEEEEPEVIEVPAQSSSGRPLRRAAVVARTAFEAVESIEEASDDAFDRMMSSHAATYAAGMAKRKAREESKKRKRAEEAKVEETRKIVRMMEKERMNREKEKRFSCALCPLYYDRHMQLHKHMIESHPGSQCPSCHQCSRVLLQRHQCFKCGEFAPNVKTHLIEQHYAVSTRRGALLECSRCPRTFDMLEDVLAHEKRDHGVLHRMGLKKKTVPVRKVPLVGGGVQVHCRVCGAGFETRYVRDQHLTKHFQSVLESVWATVERMQEERPDEFQLNQCPLCTAVMSSRKSFRTHIIHRHLIHDRSALDSLVGPGVKQEELLMVHEHIALEARKNNTYPVDLPPISMGTVKEEAREDYKSHQTQQ